MEGVLLLLGAGLSGLIVYIDHWAIANYERSESAASWCRAQFMFASDPRGAVRISSYVIAVLGIFLAVGGVMFLAGAA